MEPLILVTILGGILATKIVVEVAAQPLGDNLGMLYSNWFWTLDPKQPANQELLTVVNAMLPQVEVLQELCSVPLPY